MSCTYLLVLLLGVVVLLTTPSLADYPTQPTFKKLGSEDKPPFPKPPFPKPPFEGKPPRDHHSVLEDDSHEPVADGKPPKGKGKKPSPPHAHHPGVKDIQDPGKRPKQSGHPSVMKNEQDSKKPSVPAGKKPPSKTPTSIN